MSKTFNHEPYHIQAYRKQGRKPPKDWREKNNWRLAPDRGRDWEPDIGYRHSFTGDHFGGMQGGVVGDIAQANNRTYRAKTKQAIKDRDLEALDNLDKPVRNAWWEAF